MIKITGKHMHIEIRLGIKDRLLKRLGLKKDEEPEDPTKPVRIDVHGASILIDRQHQLPGYLREFPSYDSALPALARYVQQTLQRRITVIDVGANIGDSAAIIAAATGPDNVQLICVEADAKYLALFHENTRQLDVRLVNAIAGARSGSANLQVKTNGLGTSAVEVSDTGTATIRLDDIADGRAIDLLKIDTDGYEYEVLAGASDIMRQKDVAIFMEFSPRHLNRHGNVKPEQVIDLLLAAQFRHVIVYDNLGFVVGLFPLDDGTIGSLAAYAAQRPVFYYDFLLHRDLGFLQAFLATEMRRLRTGAPASPRIRDDIDQ